MTTTRAQGRKISQFVAKTTISGSNSYLNYIIDNTNYRIAYTDFLGGLGVTGTIVQEGAVTAAPILDTQGDINNIRGIENGSGIAANVSATDGVEIKHNFTVDATGSPLMLNTTATSPTFVSLLAGSGITLTAVGNVISISANDDLAYAESYLQGNSTATVIASTATPVLIAGTWAFGVNTGFTQTSGGRFTYNGTTTAVMTIHASITLDPVSAASQDLSVYVAKNGAVIAATRISAFISAGLTQNLSLSTNQSFATNDYVELFVRNATSTDNITVASALFGID
tara:strand:+ start:264 stop:1115 length:852 start_codon:yes stop_codon:yes gene_type:complete